MNKRNLLVAVISVFIVATLYVVLNPLTILSPTKPISTEPISTEPISYGQVTIEGEISCLQKKGNGAQTLECAIGLRDFSNRYYRLPNLDQFSKKDMFWGGQTVIITGNLSEEKSTGPDGNEYDVVGSINIEKLEITGIMEPPIEPDEY